MYDHPRLIPISIQEEILLLSDPKALHHILHVSGYQYPKKTDVIQTIRLIMGRGIFWAEGISRISFGAGFNLTKAR